MLDIKKISLFTSVLALTLSFSSAFADPDRAGELRLGSNVFSACVGNFLGLGGVNTIYRNAEALPASAGNIFDRILEVMKVRVAYSEAHLNMIPETGSVLIVANHPLGGLDGIAMGKLLKRRRPDVKIVANKILHSFPAFHDNMIFVDPFETDEARRSNGKAVIEMFRWLKAGHALAIFPAGGVSQFSWKENRVRDPDWRPSIIRMIQSTSAVTIPMYFEDRPSSLFLGTKTILHFMNQPNSSLPGSLLPHEILRRKDSTVEVKIGKPIQPKRLMSLFGENQDEAMLAYLRSRVYLLGSTHAPGTPQTRPSSVRIETPAILKPIAPAVPRINLEAEIEALSARFKILEQNALQVLWVPGSEMNLTLYELGRLRELTFRDVNEGTGKELDLDELDRHYDHMFVWDREGKQIVGAYRVGRTDQIVPTQGVHRLYAGTLFKFKPGFFENLGPALELSRLFIVKEFQKKGILQLLWKGLAGYIARNPKVTKLFGMVSISDLYQQESIQVMVEYLKRSSMHSQLATQVEGYTPPDLSVLNQHTVKEILDGIRDLEDLSDVVSQLERDGKPVPELLSHYGMMGAKYISFNKDALFGNVVDGLILVDVLETLRGPRTGGQVLIRRLAGPEGVEAILGGNP